MSSLSFLIFLTFLCSAVSFRAALASSCALSWQEGHPQVRKALKIRGKAEGKREQQRTLPSLQIWIPPEESGKGTCPGFPPNPMALTSVFLPSELWHGLLPSWGLEQLLFLILASNLKFSLHMERGYKTINSPDEITCHLFSIHTVYLLEISAQSSFPPKIPTLKSPSN